MPPGRADPGRHLRQRSAAGFGCDWRCRAAKGAAPTGILTHVYAIELAGRSERVLAREVQVDPVSDKPIHVDFMRVAATTRVHVDVAIVF